VSCKLTIQPPGLISERSLVFGHYFLSAPVAVKRLSRLIRRWKWLDKDAFISSLRSSILCADVSELQKYSAEDLFNSYDDTIRRTAVDHVPVYTA